MKIAQVAPLYESVPPKLYGGTERIVSYLTEELVARGHEVTLFAAGDSVTAAELVATAPQALRLNPDIRDPLPWHMIQMEHLRTRAHMFDIIHFHIDLMQMPLARALMAPCLTTLHGRLDLPDLAPFYRVFNDHPLVSISDDQRRPMPNVAWAGTVHHGLPENLLPFRPRPEGGYLAFLGRISPEKRPDRAIEIAVRAGWPLRIAAKVDAADREYWEQVIRPMVEAHDNVTFLGEIGESRKAAFLGEAAALLFPIDWPEPFGLVMIEAMSCGTPVIGFAEGSVPEIVEDGVNGFVVGSVEEAVEAVGRLGTLDRTRVRQSFVERFSVARMAADYEILYRRLADAPRLLPPEAQRAGSPLVVIA